MKSTKFCFVCTELSSVRLFEHGVQQRMVAPNGTEWGSSMSSECSQLKATEQDELESPKNKICDVELCEEEDLRSKRQRQCVVSRISDTSVNGFSENEVTQEQKMYSGNFGLQKERPVRICHIYN